MNESSAEAEPAGHLIAAAAQETASLRYGGEFGSGPRGHGRAGRRGSGLRMLAVTAERLAVDESLAGSPGYLPTIPADSEDRIFD